jgi:hypothetical protein
VTVYEDCRHYLLRSGPGEAQQRCRLDAAARDPFECPEGCLFHEVRVVSGAGWVQPASEPMSNTADGLAALPRPRRRKPRRGR